MIEQTTFELVRAGTLDINPGTIEQNARAFTKGMASGTTLVLLREERDADHAADARSFVTIPLPFSQAQRTAHALARTLAATPRHIADGISLAHADHIAALRMQANAFTGSATQSGAEYVAVVRGLVQALMPGEWLAISLRAASSGEGRANRRVLAHRRIVTHHSVAAGAVAVSVWGGSFDARRARDNVEQFAALTPGFDVPTRGTSVTRWSTQLLAFLTPAVITALCVLCFFAPAEVRETILPPSWSGRFWWLWAGAVSAVATAFVVWGIVSDWWPGAWRSIVTRLDIGLAPMPPRRVLPPRPPRAERTVHDANSHTERRLAASDGDYPMHPRSFLLGPHLPLAAIAPHSGAAHGGSGSSGRSAPAVLRRPIGPGLGEDDQGRTYLSAADAWSGFFAAGKAGSGKSWLLEAIWGWLLSDVDAPGVPQRRAMVAIDTKGDSKSAASYVSWGARFGRDVRRFDIAAPGIDLPGIRFFPEPGPGSRVTAESFARDVVETLTYVYGEDAIGNRSRPSLIAVFEAGSILSRRPELLSGHAERFAGYSPFWYANAMIGNRDDDDGVALADAIFQGAVACPDDAELAGSVERLTKVYGKGVTATQRRNLFDAPRSKVEPLMALDHWWTRSTQRTWAELLNSEEKVVINTGIVDGWTLDGDTQQKFGALALHTLWRTVQRTCVGWEEQNRRIAVFADEVKHLAERNASVLGWFRNNGRSFGVEAFFATQYVEQLPSELQQTVLGFGTIAMFAQSDPVIVDRLVRVLNVSAAGGVTWTAADIADLAAYHAIIHTTVDKTKVAPFVVHVAAFADMSDAEYATFHDGAEPQASA